MRTLQYILPNKTSLWGAIQANDLLSILRVCICKAELHHNTNWIKFMPGIYLRTEILHIVKLNLSWVFFFCFSFPTVSVLCWIHLVPVEHVSYILIHSIKTFICVIKIQVFKKNGYSRQLASLFGRSCIWEKKKTQK